LSREIAGMKEGWRGFVFNRRARELRCICLANVVMVSFCDGAVGEGSNSRRQVP